MGDIGSNRLGNGRNSRQGRIEAKGSDGIHDHQSMGNDVEIHHHGGPIETTNQINDASRNRVSKSAIQNLIVTNRNWPIDFDSL